MNKYFLFLVLAVFSIFLIAGCKEKKQEAEETPVSRTITFFSSDLDEPIAFDDPVAKKITELTGVTIEMQYIPGWPEETVELLIAKGNYPDLIFAKGDMTKLIEKKIVIPLDEYIEKYGTNMKKLYGNQLVKLRYTKKDPRIYSVGTYEIKNKILETSGNLQLQHAVLREFGYPKIQTLDDYEMILKAYMNKYPKINGKKTAGFSLLCNNWFWYLSLSNTGNYVIGYPDDGQWIVNQNTMQAQYKFLNDDMYVYYQWLNKLYHEGLLDPESFTQTEEMWKNKIRDGLVLGTAYPLWGLRDTQSYLVKNDMAARSFAFLPVTASKEIKDPSLTEYGFSGGWGIGISADCKNPVEVFKFLDWMCSEQAQILTNWGIEGQHYFYDGSGRRISAANITEKDGVGRWVYPFPEGGPGYIDSTGNPIGKYTKENIIKNYSYAEKETLKAYNAETWIDLFPSSSELTVPKHGQVWQYPLSSQMSQKVNEVDEYVKNELVKMILGPEKDFEKSWKTMQKNIRQKNISVVEDEITKLIQMKMDLWAQ